MDEPARDRPAFHPYHLAAWLLLGGVATLLDQLHSRTGITVYANPGWPGSQLPLSPFYAAGGALAFVAYAGAVGLPLGRRGLLGGAPLTLGRAGAATAAFVGAYALPALLSTPRLSHGPLPFVCGAALLAWALADLWSRRGTAVPSFAALVACAGVLFEWVAVSRGGYAYGICPSPACAGTPIALAWLPFLYLHAALYVARLITGAR